MFGGPETTVNLVASGTLALLLFFMGGAFSVYEGIERLRHPHPLENGLVALAVLGVAVVLEAFSLAGVIEMLVVISIIGILAALEIFGMQNAFKNSRNTQRRSDLKQYQTALENYANANNSFYPSRTTTAACSATSGQATYLCMAPGGLNITNCPEDPVFTTGGTNYYKYQSDGSGSGNPTATKYLLWAVMETSPQTVWLVCSNGKSGEVPYPYTAPTSPNQGTCPF